LHGLPPNATAISATDPSGESSADLHSDIHPDPSFNSRGNDGELAPRNGTYNSPF
jgi:hypothetical protein